jgi:hypothetical protein
MFEKNGKEMLSVLGKDPADPKGIFTVEQLPGAIAALKAAIEADKAKRPNSPTTPTRTTTQDARRRVSFFQRAVPLLELLERS